MHSFPVAVLLAVGAALGCLLPLIAGAVVRSADARAAAKRAQQQSTPSPIDTKETSNG